MEDKIEITQDKEKITFKETVTHDEASLIENYRANLMAKMMTDKKIQEGPHRIESIKVNLMVMKQTIESKDKKSENLKAIFKEHNINVEKRCRKIREIYSDKEIMTRLKGIIDNARTEMHFVDGKYEITTVSTNEIEDLLMEYMEIESNRPERLETLLQEEKSVLRVEQAMKQQDELLNKIKEKLSAVKEFFDKRGKNIDKLLDDQAASRKKGTKEARSLPNPEEVAAE